MSDNKISVLIRSHNEQDYIGFAIQSCIDFLDKPEIIILDNKSTDDTLKVVSMFSFADITIYPIDFYTPGKTLNYGASKALNKTILVLSAHAQITNLLPEHHIKGYLNDYVAVWGNQIPIYRGKRINRRYVWNNFNQKKEIENYFSEFESRYFIHNAFCFYNRETLIQYPFDETLGSKEDRYWINDMINDKGKKSYYTPDLECNHFWTPQGATWMGMA